MSTLDERTDTDLIVGTIMYNLNIDNDLYEFDSQGHNRKFIKYFCDSHTPVWTAELTCEAFVESNYDEIYEHYKDNYFVIKPYYNQLKKQYCDGNPAVNRLIDINSYLSKFGQVVNFASDALSEGCELFLWEKSDLATTVLDTDKYYVTFKYGKEDIDELYKNLFFKTGNDYDRYRKYLIEHYIPEHYSNAYINAVDKDKAIERIANEIMSFASWKNRVVATETNMPTSYNSFYSSCSNVTIRNNGAIEVHELEEYVAGVAAGENGGAGIEALKMQAILARSFAVKHCNDVIENSQKDQVYKTPTASSTQAANDTAGLILTYNGEILSEISFASYPKANYRGGFPGYESQGYYCSGVSCSTGSDGRQWCTTTLYKQPNMDKYELYMPDTTTSGGLWNGLHLTNQAGHCYGVSQVATRYFESERGYTYDQMIGEFFSSGVEVVSINNFGSGNFGNFNGQIASTKGTVYLPYELSKVLSENGTSVDALNAAIKDSVIQAGPGTRSGVIAAANTLINALAQYGYRLPYISSTGAGGSASGNYNGYGVLADWGKKGKWYSDAYKRYYYQTGLDCSGFVSWAIHNGGFKYVTAYSGSQHDLGPAHKFSSYQGQPGDIVWVEGHVGLIMGISDDGKYIVAEEQGDPSGLIISYYNMNGSAWTSIIDMTDFYANSSNLNLSYYN